MKRLRLLLDIIEVAIVIVWEPTGPGIVQNRAHAQNIARIMMKKKIYLAGNKYEGCGHKHRSTRSASRCLRKIDKTHGSAKVYTIKDRNADEEKETKAKNRCGCADNQVRNG
jgi:hypothetical protein